MNSLSKHSYLCGYELDCRLSGMAGCHAYFKKVAIGAVMLACTSCASMTPVPVEDSLEVSGQVPSVSQLLAEGDTAFAAGDLDTAQVQYALAVERESTNVEALYKLGFVHNEKASLTVAEKILRHAITADPGHMASRQTLAMVLLKLERIEEAERLLRFVLAQNPGGWEASNGLGVVMDMQGAHREAQKHFQNALQARPRSAIVANNLGYSLYLEGRYTEAETYLRQAVQFDSGYDRAWANLALVYSKNGRYRDASAAFRKIVSEHQAANNLGYLGVLEGNDKLAREQLSRALRLSPSYYEIASQNLEALNDQQKSQRGKLPELSPALPVAPAALSPQAALDASVVADAGLGASGVPTVTLPPAPLSQATLSALDRLDTEAESSNDLANNERERIASIPDLDDAMSVDEAYATTGDVTLPAREVGDDSAGTVDVSTVDTDALSDDVEVSEVETESKALGVEESERDADTFAYEVEAPMRDSAGSEDAYEVSDLTADASIAVGDASTPPQSTPDDVGSIDVDQAAVPAADAATAIVDSSADEVDTSARVASVSTVNDEVSARRADVLSDDIDVSSSDADALTADVPVLTVGASELATRKNRRSDTFADMQMHLQFLGYYTGIVDGKYGPMTRNAIMQYQKSQKLTADGFADDSTVYLLTRSVVAKLQRMLTSLGYETGPAIGDMNKTTRSAIRQFQRQNGLDETGSIDAALLESIADTRQRTIDGMNSWQTEDFSSRG